MVGASVISGGRRCGGLCAGSVSSDGRAGEVGASGGDRMGMTGWEGCRALVPSPSCRDVVARVGCGCVLSAWQLEDRNGKLVIKLGCVVIIWAGLESGSTCRTKWVPYL
jgi:hypothetical protein